QRRQEGKRVSPLLLVRYQVADRVVLSRARQALGLDQATMVASGAAPIDKEVLLFFASLGLEICEVYGQTEDCGITTINRPGQTRFGTVGTRLPNIEVKLADDGEILVRGE